MVLLEILAMSVEQNLDDARGVVLAPSEELSDHTLTEVKGYDFNNGVDYKKLLETYAATGFQATHFGKAVEASFLSYLFLLASIRISTCSCKMSMFRS